MSATATLPEIPSSLCGESSDCPVVVDCLSGTDRPRWELIEKSYYEDRLAGLEESVTVAPLFHVKAKAPPFSLCLELRCAVFAGQYPDTRFHTTHEALHPVSFVWNDRRHVRVAWNGPGSAVEDWGRWIYRFYVQEEKNPGEPRPIYLAFTYLTEETKPKLLRRLRPQPPARPPAAAAALPGTASKLRIDLRLSSEGDPVFRELFRYGEDVVLPDDVYLEPLIVVKESEKRVDLEFTTAGGSTLYPDKADACDPGVAGMSPLALVWRGVTHAKKGCGSEERTSSRGFLASWCDPKAGSATLCWSEPPKDEVTRRASSFFFTDWGFKGSGEESLSGVRERSHALVDPTVIHDQDSPPPGS